MTCYLVISHFGFDGRFLGLVVQVPGIPCLLLFEIFQHVSFVFFFFVFLPFSHNIFSL